MITNLKDTECVNLLADNYIGQLGYVYKERPFIVPMTYYFDNKRSIIGYSEDGHKTMAMRKNRNVSLHVSVKENKDLYNTILAHGTYKEISGSESKKYLHEFSAGIIALILRKEERNLHCIGEFSHKINTQNIPIIFKITVDEITGKRITRNTP
jgi:nitroimidazol reductase NimA-like FMN-containing flavoprotein (pyridoxamine 5'-phosphate oxidase superfamily)